MLYFVLEVMKSTPLLIIIVAAFVVGSESTIFDNRPLGSPRCQRRDSIGRCRPDPNCRSRGKREMPKKFNEIRRKMIRTMEEDNIKTDN